MKNKRTYYLAYLEINQDGDFYIEHYKDLDYDHVLFENFDEAVETVKQHLKLAIDTISSSRDISGMKEFMTEVYNDTEWDLLDEDEECPLFIDEEYGNWGIRYYIKKVRFL